MLQSPFHSVHQRLDANFDTFDGWNLPADFGDPDAERAALSDSCAVVDLCSFGRILVSGKTAKDTINTLFTTEKGKIIPDSWSWARPNSQAEQILCRIFKLNGSYTILVRPDQTEPLFKWLQSAAGSGVSVTDLTSKTAMLGLYGPKAFDSIRGVLPFDIGHLDTGDVEKVSFVMMNFTILRGSWLDGDGLELICPVAAGPLAAGAVAKYRHKHNLTPAGMNCLKTAMAQIQKPL